MPPEQTYDTKKIVIFGIIILLVVALIGYLIFRKVTSPTDSANQKNLFPYDVTSYTPGSGSGTNTPAIENPVVETPLTSTTADRLRLVASYPVTSMYAFMKDVITSEPKFDELSKQTLMVSKATPTNYVRFNAKQNGFLVDAEMTKNIITISQKTDTAVPNSQEVWFGNHGDSITFRSWNQQHQTIDTFTGTVPSPGSIDYCHATFGPALTAKSKKPDIKEFQKYVDAKLSLTLAIDGVFGKKLAAAIKPLQKTLMVPTNGKYDKVLADAMNTDCTNTLALLAQQGAGTQKVTGDFLDTGILRGSMSPDGTQMFFLKPVATGVVGIVADSTGKNQHQVFSSPLTEWRPQWVNPTTIAMTTLASSQADGFLYFLNPVTGNFQKVLGPVKGLTTLVNPSATTVLVSESTKKNMTFGTYQVSTGNVTPLDLTTLPEKCAWQDSSVVICAVPQRIPDGQYPDDWYQGNTAFNDAFWSIETATGSTTSIAAPSQQFDAYNLVISPDNGYFYFINKIDSSLWSYRLGDE